MRPAIPRWPFTLAVALGLGLRLLHYCRRDSLWGDEAMVALNIAGRSYAGLLRPLDYGQLAPVPFLWIERTAIQLFGTNELALRALPLIASCVLVILLVPFGRRILSPLETLLAVGLAATSTWLIRYAVELKPYGLDALVAVLMVWAAVIVHQHPSRTTAWWRLTGFVGLGSLATPTALFVGFGVLVALGIDLAKAFTWRNAARLAAVGGVCAVAQLVTYQAWYRVAAGAPYLADFWSAAFLIPGTPGLAARTWAALEETLLPVVDWLVALPPLAGLLLVVLLLGAVRLSRRHGPAVPVMLAFPALAAFLASAAGRYPIATRLMLFASPLLICLAAAGFVAVAAWVHRWVPTVRVRVLAAAFLIPSTEIALRLAIGHQQDEEMRPLVAALSSRIKENEPVYVFFRAIPAWTFYTTDWSSPDTARMHRIALEAGPGGPSHENGESRGSRSQGEGAQLMDSANHRVELLGVSSGIRGRQWLGYQPATPDPGWSLNEAARLRAAASPGIWLVLINARNRSEGDSLLAAAGRAGGVERDSILVPGGKAVRVTFE